MNPLFDSIKFTWRYTRVNRDGFGAFLLFGIVSLLVGLSANIVPLFGLIIADIVAYSILITSILSIITPNRIIDTLDNQYKPVVKVRAKLYVLYLLAIFIGTLLSLATLFLYLGPAPLTTAEIWTFELNVYIMYAGGFSLPFLLGISIFTQFADILSVKNTSSISSIRESISLVREHIIVASLYWILKNTMYVLFVGGIYSFASNVFFGLQSGILYLLLITPIILGVILFFILMNMSRVRFAELLRNQSE